jgi:hypothetical protein
LHGCLFWHSVAFAAVTAVALARQKYWQIRRPQREPKMPTLCNYKT